MCLKMTIDPVEYRYFRDRWAAKDYGAQRLGQAFHNHFGLHKSTQNKDKFDRLYEADGEDAETLINSLFEFI